MKFASSLALMLCITAFAQKPTEIQLTPKQLDSLVTLTSRNKVDTIQFNYYQRITREYRNMGRIKEAMAYAKKALSLSEKLKNPKKIYLAHIEMALVYMPLRDFEEIIKHAEIASNGFKKINDTKAFLNAERLIGWSYLLSNRSEDAISRFEKALAIPQTPSTLFERAKLHMHLADAYSVEDNFPKAMNSLEKALQYFNKLQFTDGINAIYWSMADIYMKTNDWNQAKKYSLLNYENLKKSPYFSEPNLAEASQGLGLIEMKLGNYTSALSYLQGAMKIYRKYGQSVSPSLRENLKITAEIYLIKKQPQKAIEAANSALAYINSKLPEAYKDDNDASEIELYNILHMSYMQLQDNRNATINENKLTKSLADYEKNEDNTSLDNEIYKDLGQTNQTTGNYKEASYYFEKYAAKQKERFQKEKSEKVSQLQAKFELTDKDMQLKDLTINKQKNALAMARQKNTLLVTITILAIILIISIFLYWRYRLNKKSNIILKSKNAEIESSLNEKSILLKEIHHRVKNNLQLVISLLNIQARENNHTAVDAFLEKGRGRIISMALIHQNLYEADNLAKVNFQEYLENLINSNAETYGQDMSNVTFSINANEMYFDVQTSIPLGLIINELICNAMKHAFSPDHKGVVAIVINKKQSGEFELLFSDNGTGIDSSKKAGKTFGTDLVKLLAMQLKGEVTVDTQSGTAYNISFEDIAA